MDRLIIVEGLPCSGKSTAARYIAQRLGARLYDEGSGSHPADYEFHAFLKPEELDAFAPLEQALIKQKAAYTASGYAVPLSEFEGGLFDRLLQHKIYDFLPWETEKPVMLEKWREFVNSARPNERYVFNCVLLQNPMCETMMRFGFDTESSAAYIGEIAHIIAPLKPLVIYLYSDNIRENIENALPERGEEWLGGVIDYHCGGAYGRANGLSGFEGYISALEERQHRETAILRGLDIRHIIIDDPHGDRDKAYSKIDKELR